MNSGDSPAVETYRAVLRTARRMKRRIDPILAAHGLTGAQFVTLGRIPPQGIRLSRLAAMSWADPATVTGIVDRLARDGIVRRERSQDDRRVVRVFLTERGDALLQRLTPVHREAVDSLMAPLSAEEAHTLQTLLQRIEADLTDPPAKSKEVRR